jgi:uncharacterized protein (DUF362 family)
MAFYQCPKCKKTWQYPIEKCPHCLQGLRRLSAKKARVIGVSQITIPTILHPQVPYFVLVLEDENGNKWVQKSIKDYKIGEEFKVESTFSADAPTRYKAVAVWRVKYDILETIEKVVDLIGGINISKDSKILILPTLIAPKHPYFAQNTNPKFLEALLQYLKQQGAETKNIQVAAQSFDEIPIEASAQKSQLLKVCLSHQITPLDLAKSNFIKKEENGFTCEIAEEVFNSNLIINLPILKLDKKLGVKGAAENSLKFLKKESYLSWRYLYGQEEIMENIQKVLPLYLTIADAQTIQKTNGFTSFLGLTLAGFAPLNLDRVFAEICLAKDLPEYLKKIKIEDIPMAGRIISELQYEVDKF